MPAEAPWRQRLPAGVADSALLTQALTHRSAAVLHNERLEFLGDSVLNQVISAQLYDQCPESPEGDLSRLRASLVNQDSLAAIARGLGLGESLLLGEGERKSGGKRRDSILADALEAVIGAVFLLAGHAAAQRFILDLYTERLAQLPSAQSLKDPKTQLQEYLQDRGIEIPLYKTLEVLGPTHAQQFRVSCAIAALSLSLEGQGSSRRRAEQDAAARVLAQLQQETGAHGAS
ncbi:ribonuclease III [Ectothiorhodosinus mongolicus]|nr:ribonuclease III [Ectothiorhodosinus mongolicus]ULX57872.1 ribonuclease III [Ectothiorhodosinus mongolicus]